MTRATSGQRTRLLPSEAERYRCQVAKETLAVAVMTSRPAAGWAVSLVLQDPSGLRGRTWLTRIVAKPLPPIPP